MQLMQGLARHASGRGSVNNVGAGVQQGMQRSRVADRTLLLKQDCAGSQAGQLAAAGRECRPHQRSLLQCALSVACKRLAPLRDPAALCRKYTVSAATESERLERRLIWLSASRHRTVRAAGLDSRPGHASGSRNPGHCAEVGAGASLPG